MSVTEHRYRPGRISFFVKNKTKRKRGKKKKKKRRGEKEGLKRKRHFVHAFIHICVCVCVCMCVFFGNCYTVTDLRRSDPEFLRFWSTDPLQDRIDSPSSRTLDALDQLRFDSMHTCAHRARLSLKKKKKKIGRFDNELKIVGVVW